MFAMVPAAPKVASEARIRRTKSSNMFPLEFRGFVCQTESSESAATPGLGSKGERTRAPMMSAR